MAENVSQAFMSLSLNCAKCHDHPLVADWQQDPAVYLSQSTFERINTLRDGLSPSADEADFLLRAAVLYDEGVSYWLDQVNEPDAQAEILLEMLQSDAASARLTAARYLARYPKDNAATALASRSLEDPEPAVQPKQ